MIGNSTSDTVNVLESRKRKREDMQSNSETTSQERKEKRCNEEERPDHLINETDHGRDLACVSRVTKISPDKISIDMSPDCYLKQLIEAMTGMKPKPTPVLSIGTEFFLSPTEEDLASYTTESIMAIRDGDIEGIRELHEKGLSLQACNRFGESLLHTACRRGFTEIVKFMVNEANVSIRVRDDYGRTPLHDACWNRYPRFDLIDILIKKEPSLLLLTDRRGFTPFEYARREDWPKWIQFLFNKRQYLSIDGETSMSFCFDKV